MKSVIFESNTLDAIRNFPDDARQRTGYELDRVQRGLEPENWKPFSSVGQGVREIRIQVGMQFRVMYIVKFGDAVHVLHAFQKKTQKTKKSDIDIAKSAYKEIVNRCR